MGKMTLGGGSAATVVEKAKKRGEGEKAGRKVANRLSGNPTYRISKRQACLTTSLSKRTVLGSDLLDDFQIRTLLA